MKSPASAFLTKCCAKSNKKSELEPLDILHSPIRFSDWKHVPMQDLMGSKICVHFHDILICGRHQRRSISNSWTQGKSPSSEGSPNQSGFGSFWSSRTPQNLWDFGSSEAPISDFARALLCWLYHILCELKNFPCCSRINRRGQGSHLFFHLLGKNIVTEQSTCSNPRKTSRKEKSPFQCFSWNGI